MTSFNLTGFLSLNPQIFYSDYIAPGSLAHNNRVLLPGNIRIEQPDHYRIPAWQVLAGIPVSPASYGDPHCFSLQGAEHPLHGSSQHYRKQV